jgi:hypothetical protein
LTKNNVKSEEFVDRVGNDATIANGNEGPGSGNPAELAMHPDHGGQIVL